MEEQDTLLYNSLIQFKFNLPQNVNKVADIDGDILQTICVQFLQKLGFESKPINSQQKFRIATKISEDLKKEGGLRMEINTLINPNIQELRKILISMISRLSMSENANNQQNQKVETYQEKVDKIRDFQKKQAIRQWRSEEWIHPCLLNDRAKKQFRTHDTNVQLNSKNLQKVLLISNFDAEIKPNFFASLAAVIDGAKQKIKEKQIKNDRLYNNNDQIEGNQQQNHQLQIQDMISKNNQDWKNLKKNQINKLAQKMKQQKDSELLQQQQTQNEDANKVTLFELEQQFQGNEVKTGQDDEDQNNQSEKLDLEALKTKHQEEVQEVQDKIDVLQQKIDKFENKKQKMEENYNNKNDEAQSYKEANKQLKQNVESLHLLLSNLENNSNMSELVKQIKDLETEIKNIDSEWGTIRNELESTINNYQTEIDEKKLKLDQQREKSRRLETDYITLTQDIRNHYDLKEQLKIDCQSLPTEVYGRQKYIRSITEISKNYNRQQEEIGKIVQEVSQQEILIRGQQGTLERFYIEFENAFNTDNKKKESLHVQIYKIYEDYKNIFAKTVKTLNESADSKIKMREADSKTELIGTKKYNQNVQKLQNDLQGMKAENQNLQVQFDQLRAQYQQQQ